MPELSRSSKKNQLKWEREPSSMLGANKHMLFPSCLILKARRGYAGISANDGVGHGYGVGTGTGPGIEDGNPSGSNPRGTIIFN